MVLGNHDLHLLSRAAGTARRKKEDTLEEILAAPDRDELLGWLGMRPLVHRFGPFVMVHAGLLPEWTIEQTWSLAAAVQERLAGPARDDLLRSISSGRGKKRKDSGAHDDALAAAAAAMTRIRMVDSTGKAELGYSRAPGDAPWGWRPWFETSTVRRQGYALIFGHWAMLGFHREHDVACVDSGCVYGGSLTALRLRDGHVVHEPVADAVAKRD